MLRLALLLISFCFALYLLPFSRNKNVPPPGPKGLFFLGNAKQLARGKPWMWWTELSKRYGDITRLTVPGQEIIVLHTLEAAQDLLVKRSSIYSDRPRMVMIGDIIGLKLSTVFMAYGDRWKAQRKLWHQLLGQGVVGEYYPLVRRKSIDFVKSAHERGDVCKALHRGIVGIMMSIAYGIDITAEGEWPQRLSTWAGDVVKTGAPGKHLVESIPLMKYIPSWMPGAGWKRAGERLRIISLEIADEPYRRVKQLLADGLAPKCLTTQMLESDYEGFAGTEDCQKWISGTVYGAGVGTTQAVLRRFIYAMITYPDIQKRAQAEVDSVTEGRRLPTLDEAKSLPYLRAVITECLRWLAFLPSSSPHRLMSDDVYNGYLLRKGSTIILNVWAITNDPKEYPDPERFLPDRFLGPSPALDPRAYVFGVGRRICAGRDLAEATLFWFASIMLATSILLKPLNAEGQEIEPELTFGGSALTNELYPFECRIEPRSPDMAAVLESESDAAREL